MILFSGSFFLSGSGGEQVEVFYDESLLLFQAVLHDKAGVFEGDDFAEPTFFFVKAEECAVVLVIAQAIAPVGEEAEGDLFFE